MDNLKQLIKKALLYMCVFGIILVAGTYIFVKLEDPQKEEKNKLKAKMTKLQDHVLKNFNISLDLLNDYADLRKAESEFQGGLNPMQAFHLSLSIAFTTGWGIYVPTTDNSKIFFIFYACVSISIATIMLKNLGDILHCLFRRLIQWTEKRVFSNNHVRFIYLKCVIMAMLLLIIFILINSSFFARQAVSYLDAVYGCIQLYSTIGFGDIENLRNLVNSTHPAAVPALLAMSMIGMALLATVISSLVKFQEKGYHKIHKQLRESTTYVQEQLSKIEQSHNGEKQQLAVSSLPCKNIVKELGFECNSGERLASQQKNNIQ